MQVVCLLNQKYPNLAVAELNTILKPTAIKLIPPYAIITTTKRAFDRLALTKKVYQLLFTATKKTIETKIKKYNWQPHYTPPYKIETSKGLNKSQLTSALWNTLEHPKVNLKLPTTLFSFLLINKTIHTTTLIHENNQDFTTRISHRLPAPHPSALDPKLARAMINLTGAKKGDTIVDPFCGAGSLLLEASLLRMKARGSDIDPIMLKRAALNLKSFNATHYSLTQQDALTKKRSTNYLVADLPYGKNTKLNTQLHTLYQTFLHRLPTICNKRAVLGFPDTKEVRKIIKKSKLKVTHTFSHYIHKSLSKLIVVVEC